MAHTKVVIMQEIPSANTGFLSGKVSAAPWACHTIGIVDRFGAAWIMQCHVGAPMAITCAAVTCKLQQTIACQVLTLVKLLHDSGKVPTIEFCVRFRANNCIGIGVSAFTLHDIR